MLQIDACQALIFLTSDLDRIGPDLSTTESLALGRFPAARAGETRAVLLTLAGATARP